MRSSRHPFSGINSRLSAAVRTTQRLEAEVWRSARPHVLRRFAARATGLRWTRALVKLVVTELTTDDLFVTLVGPLQRVPRGQWPRAVAIAVALRHSWRRDALTSIARRLHVSLADATHARHTRPSRNRVSGSPRRRQGSPRRSDPARRG